MKPIFRKAILPTGILLALGAGLLAHRSYRGSQTAAQGSHADFSPTRQTVGNHTPHPKDGETRLRTERTRAAKDPITPESARRKLEEARAIPNLRERANECRKIIAALCEAGFPEEAWSLIETNPGIVRSSELFAFFSSSGLTLEALSGKMEGLLYDGESSEALGGYFSSLSLAEMASLVTRDRKALGSLPGMDDRGLKRAITEDLLNKLSAAKSGKNDPVEVLRTAVDFHRGGLVTDFGLASILKIDPTRDTFQKYQALSAAVENTGPGIEASEVRNDFIRDMIYEDAPRTMETVVLSRGQKGLNDLATAVERYELIDPVRAVKWYDENLTRLSPAQQDAASIAFFRSALRDVTPDKASTWLERIQNPQMKQEAEAALAKRFSMETGSPTQNQ